MGRKIEKAAVITGGSSGIGLCAAKALLQQSCRVSMRKKQPLTDQRLFLRFKFDYSSRCGTSKYTLRRKMLPSASPPKGA